MSSGGTAGLWEMADFHEQEVTSDEQGCCWDHNVGGRVHHRTGRRARQGARGGRRAAPLLRFGGPWTHADETKAEPTGAVVAGRGTYEAARHWGDQNPWGMPLFIVTHRPEEEPDGGDFTFVSGVEAAVERAREAVGDKDVHVMGGAETIRQALEAGLVDELSIIVAPVVLGDGKRLFEGFSQSLDLEQLGVRQSQFATFIDYRLKR